MQFRIGVIGREPMIVLCNAAVQLQIELAPTDRLGEQIRHARFVIGARLGIDLLESLFKARGQLQCFGKDGQLRFVDFDGYLDACFPTAFFHIKHAHDRIQPFRNRFGAEE